MSYSYAVDFGFVPADCVVAYEIPSDKEVTYKKQYKVIFLEEKTRERDSRYILRKHPNKEGYRKGDKYLSDKTLTFSSLDKAVKTVNQLLKAKQIKDIQIISETIQIKRDFHSDYKQKRLIDEFNLFDYIRD